MAGTAFMMANRSLACTDNIPQQQAGTSVGGRIRVMQGPFLQRHSLLILRLLLSNASSACSGSAARSCTCTAHTQRKGSAPVC